MSSSRPHRRYNPLLDEWLIVAPQRCKRPWAGQTEANKEEQKPASGGTEQKNPLQPGGVRAGAIRTPDYEGTFVFTNDFPALVPDQVDVDEDAAKSEGDDDLLKSQGIRGTCRVMCYHPRSDLQLATMQHDDVVSVIAEWQRQTTELGAEYDWVQVFENKGAIVGCSNPHPHCQIWAGDFIPNQIATKNRTQLDHYAKKGTAMLLDYAQLELKQKSRIVITNEHWLVVVPYWAVWPYETLLLPLFKVARITQLNDSQRSSLADIMKRLLIKYDNLFKCSFPYSMGWHGAPTGQYLQDQDLMNAWQLHAVYLPPLLRSATVKKFMAGYELVCEAQRDLTAEMAAQTLRDLDDRLHYTTTTQ